MKDNTLAKALNDLANPNTPELTIDDNTITVYDAKAIGEALGKNTTLKTLVLRMNSIHDDALKPIADALAINKGLVKISLAYNDIDDDGAAYLGECLAKNTTLRILSLRDNVLITDKGLQSLYTALKGINTTLIVIGLRGLQFEHKINPELIGKINTMLIENVCQKNGEGRFRALKAAREIVKIEGDDSQLQEIDRLIELAGPTRRPALVLNMANTSNASSGNGSSTPRPPN